MSIIFILRVWVVLRYFVVIVLLFYPITWFFQVASTIPQVTNKEWVHLKQCCC